MSGLDCSASTGRIGILLRHTFEPAARVTPWVGIGTGYAFGHVYATQDGSGDVSETVVRYSGWEMLRLVGGIDLRSNHVLGVGFYGGIGFSRFSDIENAAGTEDLPGRSTHTAVEAGIRLTLFP